MPDSKLDLKNAGSLRLMELDTSTLFLPFGRPLADYLRGGAGNQNGSKALLQPGAVEFSPEVRWNASISCLLRTTGFGELERDGLVQSATPAAEPADPAVADFLPFERPDATSRDSNEARISPAIAPESLPVSLPRISALPLRPRMTFGPPPAAKTKPAAATPAPKPVIVPPAAKPAPPAAAPPKPVTILAPKPAATPKPATAIPPAPRPVVTPISAPKPAAPTQPKPSPTPARAPVSSPRTRESAVSTIEAPPPPPPPVSKPPVVAPIVEPAPPATPPAPVAAPVHEAPAFTHEPHLSMGADAESRSFLEKVPFPAKIGLAIALVLGVLFFVFGKTGDAPAARGVQVGEQGWSNEWASDSVGSRRGRQLTLYRPSTGLGDYQMQFTGQIESKALGWVFRAADTKNYYAMKIENTKPGAMAISHFAVVEGRESSSSQRPLSVDARPGAVYKVKLDVTGPKFTVSIGGEPVDFWTDNRIKAGAVGFMNEREERGVTNSVQFSFPQGRK